MDAKLLQRVMDLAERTGDRVIVVNPQSGEAHAIMPLDEYEGLVDNRASLQDLGDGFDFKAGDEDDCPLCEDLGVDFSKPAKEEEGSRPSPIDETPAEAGAVKKPQTEARPLITDEEIEKAIAHDIEVMKMAEESLKNEEAGTPLDVLDDEANEEEYYLEPLE